MNRSTYAVKSGARSHGNLRGAIYFGMHSDYIAKYQTHMLEKARANGESPEVIAQKQAEMEKFAKMYDNPVINVAVTFMEPLPVALIMTLVSAGVLSRRKKPSPGAAAAA